MNKLSLNILALPSILIDPDTYKRQGKDIIDATTRTYHKYNDRVGVMQVIRGHFVEPIRIQPKQAWRDA